MKFYVGVHHPHKANLVEMAFISVHAIQNRKSSFPVNKWIMDSGAFTTISKYGGYPEPVSAYADQIRRWKSNGELVAAVSQDYMCESHMLAKTGMTIHEHQVLTVSRYDQLIAEDTGVYIMPVLQGYDPQDYVRHLEMYGPRLAYGAYVGVGSVCKRNANPSAIAEVLFAIKSKRPDLRLHGFGVKTTALIWDSVRDNLYSADSMAWSFAARMEGGNANDYAHAVKFEQRIKHQPVQMSLI
jgi:hypothetical protein